jgi:hypothetical protein
LNQVYESNGIDRAHLRAAQYSQTNSDHPSKPKIIVPTYDKKKISREQQWKDESTWSTVSPESYQNVIKQAHEELAPLVKQVYTDCQMIVTPTTNDFPFPNRKDHIKFRCHGKLQDEPCNSGANLCLVTPHHSITANVDSVHNTNDMYNQNKTALLMLVDGLDYLLYNEKGDFPWKSFLNKAAYAYQSQRPLFIWLGRLHDEKNSLHIRNNEAIYDAFGAACDPGHHVPSDQNTLHYYKAIAVAALFHKQRVVPNVNSAFFLDADMSFSDEAFERIASINNTNVANNVFGPEDYLEISAQASLLGAQNTAGQIVMNSGAMVLRNTAWSHDFSALWWFSRCGHKDQRGLWLVLFATWSAITGSDDAHMNRKQFAYPGKISCERTMITFGYFMSLIVVY